MKINRFAVTPQIIKSAMDVFEARTIYSVIRSRVEEVQNRILAENNYFISEDCMIREEDHEPIRDFHNAWLMTDESFSDYHTRCEEAKAKAKLFPAKPK